MSRSSRDEEFSAFVQTRRTGLVRPACLPTPGTGKFDVQDNTEILTFQIAGGQWVVVQASVSLGWDSAELAKFAGGVQVPVTAAGARLSRPAWHDGCRHEPHDGSRPLVQVGYGVGRPR